MNSVKINSYQESDKYIELKNEDIQYQDYPIRASCKTVIGHDSSCSSSNASDSESDSDTSSLEGSSSSFSFQCETLHGIVVVTKRRMFIYNCDSQATILNMPWNDSRACALDMKLKDSDLNMLEISVNPENCSNPEENIEMTISISSQLAQNIFKFSKQNISI